MCKHRPNGDNVCVKCGLVGGQVLVSGEIPFRQYRGEEITNADLSTGTKHRFHDKMLGSKETHVSSKDRWFREAFFEMDKLAELLQLARGTQEEIAYLWRKLRKGDNTQGRETLKLLGGLAWLVCRLRRIPRTLDEINKAVKELGGREVDGATLNFLAGKLSKRPPLPEPLDFIDRFANKVGLTAEQTRRAFELGCGLKVRGKPHVVAGALCYIASGKTLNSASGKLGINTSSLWRTAGKIRA